MGRIMKGRERRNITKSARTDTKALILCSPNISIRLCLTYKPYFEWPRPMGGSPNAKNAKLQCSYHKDHEHKTENYKILKQFLKRLITKCHLVEYVKEGKSVRNSNEDDEPVKRTTNRVMVDLIEAIHGVMNRESKKML